ncbi:Wzy polymerase domain-containing protein [Scandinavium goeteborgense]|uniref:PglL family O-oligosaccharyltransferase n=1 Tax=Scandinavium goeteborgense TaxID=1851514 RepID=UPI00380C8B71
MIIASYFMIFMNIYIPNMGGTGLKLPSNILCWSVIALIIILAGISLYSSSNALPHRTFRFFVLGGIFLSLPALYTSQLVLSGALVRIAGLWGGIALFWALLQMKFNPWQKNFLLFSLMVSTLVQFSFALWQLKTQTYDNWMEYIPGTRPYGIFQQVNVLASFLATGYAIAVSFSLISSRFLVKNFSRAALVLLTMILVILQSRIGYLGPAIILVLYCGIYYRQPGKIVIILALSLFGVIAGKLLLHDYSLTHLVAQVDKESSNSERINILKATIEMIRQHPIIGWGYGHFEYVVARISWQFFQHSYPIPVTHAHNEFLFGWAEGGISAVIGMLAIAGGYLILIKDKFPSSLQIWILTLPITLHLMTEYPLYQSTTHWFTLILLCRLCISEKEQKYNLPVNRKIKLLSFLIVITSSCVLLFLVSGFKTNQVLTDLERSGMRDFTPAEHLANPWIQWDRYIYDYHIAMLMQFNANHNEKLLSNFSYWGTEYIKIHNDKNIYHTLMTIAHYQKNYQQEEQLYQQQSLMVPIYKNH